MLRNILAVIAGIVIGGLVNSVLVMLGPSVFPTPAGVDVNNIDSLRASMHLFEPKHFVMPFLAHALGTFVGAFIAYKFSVTHRPVWAYGIGVLFLCGGIAAALMLPAPMWFEALDLTAAYMPMAWLAVQMGGPATPRR